MARQTTVRLTDDIDGSEATEAVTFALRGVEYEIDLGVKNVAALEKALSRFIAAGRKVSRARPTAAAAPGRQDVAPARREVADVRQWAHANGYAVSSRGRIPSDVRDAYDAATG